MTLCEWLLIAILGVLAIIAWILGTLNANLVRAANYMADRD